MVSSANVAFGSADAFLVHLFRFPRDLLSVLYALSARERRTERNSSRVRSGDLAIDWHDRTAVLGASGRPHRRTHARVSVSHHRYGARLSRPRLRTGLLVDHA